MKKLIVKLQKILTIIPQDEKNTRLRNQLRELVHSCLMADDSLLDEKEGRANSILLPSLYLDNPEPWQNRVAEIWTSDFPLNVIFEG